MDGMLSDEEKIRRAEILEARRQSKIPVENINSSTKKMSRLTKYSLQILISICMFGIVYFLSQHNLINENIKTIFNGDIDFKGIYLNLNERINSTEKLEKNETTNVTENVVEKSGIGGTNEIMEESKNDDDVTYITKKFSFIKPVNGVVTSRYGLRDGNEIVSNNHGGIDIGCNVGTQVVSAIDGKVELVSTYGDYGTHVKITNGDVSILYAHCSKILVKQGDEVKRGQVVAESGNTGRTTGPHLHFEIRRNNNTIDPQKIVNFE